MMLLFRKNHTSGVKKASVANRQGTVLLQGPGNPCRSPTTVASNVANVTSWPTWISIGCVVEQLKRNVKGNDGVGIVTQVSPASGVNRCKSSPVRLSWSTLIPALMLAGAVASARLATRIAHDHVVVGGSVPWPNCSDGASGGEQSC